ncbi:alpha-1,2-galactosyltransferase [Schizosaccharomyces japonicus yFS275]|uniref:Alpha-1,2-galactosyltransferase n=1 Tax=Schizosaccharomyces japonicus (strain yFS275 / FY16936) TaxID=402676 RepID=B6K317_SCHJY|nr:alpha-1,2-galactosyltransferase [Schizosaccharomyces japonicus yFS275]EEB07874.1 alpha-1,2-galactosyltransferase [Schizosaccharomyces japonicus yFS275]
MWNPKQRSKTLATLKSFPYPKPSLNSKDSDGQKRRKWLPLVPKSNVKRALAAIALVFLLFLCGKTLYGSSNSKIVIVVASNEGGGVREVKNRKQWALERTSLSNKVAYAKKHGYYISIKDVGLKRRYTHEWRESWEKADLLLEAMKDFPRAEWFWWLDLTTYIMEPSKSIEKHVIDRLDKIGTRNLTEPGAHNPLNYEPIPHEDFTGDVNMVLTQDCNGFSLGSFFIRRSEWTTRLLDVLWDPVVYGKMHQNWAHQEQDALQHMYETHAWVRNGVIFVPQRTINAFPRGACEGSTDARFFYDQKDRDFVVNMAGCMFGRDCTEELAFYKQLSEKLNSWRFW